MATFTIERLLELFWLAVQQFCFVWLKYAHDGAACGAGHGVRLTAEQCMVFLAFAVFSFQPELGLNFMSRFYDLRGIDYFAWIVRMTLCGAMVLFDALLVLYFSRLVRICRRGLPQDSSTLCGDLLLVLAVALPVIVYICAGIGASERHLFGWEQYMWVGRFFVALANCAYIALEGAAAVMFWRFVRKLEAQDHV